MTEQQSAFSEAKESRMRLVRSVAWDLNIFGVKPHLPMLPGSPGLESGGASKWFIGLRFRSLQFCRR